MYTNQEELIYGVFMAAIVMLLLIALIILLVYQYLRVRLQKEKDILKAVFITQEDERNRISEDLHDDIGARLSALKLQNELLIAEPLNREAGNLAANNSRMIDTIVKEIRRIVRNQASKFIIENGIESELEVLCQQYRFLNNISINLHYEEPSYELTPDFQVAMFRIIQELLHNTIKHSGATQVDIHFGFSPVSLNASYIDNGKGFEVSSASGSGMGMKNIRTRANLYSGNLTIQSLPARETRFEFAFNKNDISK